MTSQWVGESPKLVSISVPGKALRSAAGWVPLLRRGFLKFNVDGSALEKPGSAGIGGVLRNTNGESSFDLIIESDSLNAVNWFNNHDLIPWRLKKFCPTIDSFKSAVIDWKVHHVLQESDKVADGLAKSGVSRTNYLLFLV
ncbi:hypothetical protein REPUB_Repub16aG0082800 [Reevesia pubescens]